MDKQKYSERASVYRKSGRRITSSSTTPRRHWVLLFLLLLLAHHHLEAFPVVTAWKFRLFRGNTKQQQQQQQPYQQQQAPQQQAQQQQQQQQHAPPPTAATTLNLIRSLPSSMQEATQWWREKVSQSWQVPPVVTRTFWTSWTKLKAALLYQPPVGFVTTVTISRLILSGRLFRIRQKEPERSVEDELSDKDIASTGRSLLLDLDDAVYVAHGGIERVRRRLCEAAVNGLRTMLQQQQINKEEDDSSNTANQQSLPLQQYRELIEAAAQALTVTFRPTGSRLRFAVEMVEPVSKLETGVQRMVHNRPKQQAASSSATKTTTPDDTNENSIITNNQLEQLLETASMTASIRATDAVLRLARDRMLQTTYRLARTMEHWQRRVQQTRHWRRMVQTALRHSIESDRTQLAIAQAAYRSQVARLGEITALLLQRPDELPEEKLLQALKATEERQSAAATAAASNPNVGTTLFPSRSDKDDNTKQRLSPVAQARQYFSNALQKRKKQRTSAPADDNEPLAKSDHSPVLEKARAFLAKFVHTHGTRYSLRWNTAGGKSLFSIRRFDASDGVMDVPSAVQALLSDDSNSLWMEQAREWNQQARRVVCRIVSGCLQDSTSDSWTEQCSPAGFRLLNETWCAGPADSSIAASSSPSSPPLPNALVVEEQWRSLINYVDQSPSWRRIGEGQKIRLRDAFRFVDWYKNWDIMGIPSSIMLIYAAQIVHDRFVQPHWAATRQELVEAAQKATEIFQTRAWEPLKGIYDDIMNKDPSMMSALGLDVEEASLDHMLRDLNFGDGTPATRQEALKQATEQYEHDLSSGLVTNFIRGRLVRLMLIQVQQLKVGLLSALDSIDVLIQGNRIYFKVLAAIPAVVMASYGTRYLMRGLYNFRAKDIRPITAVHGEMSQYLTRIEDLLLLSDQVDLTEEIVFEDRDLTARVRPQQAKKKDGSRKSNATTSLKPVELGELMLNMHRYLILLDFSSPPFPSHNCDQIHQALQQFPLHFGLGRQLQWLSRIQQKHQDLVKSI